MQRRVMSEWISPLAYAAGIDEAETHWTLFYSGLQQPYSGRYSILALGIRDEIKSGGWSSAAEMLSTNRDIYDNAWFGYLGYGLKNFSEQLPEDKTDEISIASAMPDIWLMKFGLIMRFDHINRKTEIFYEDELALALMPTPAAIGAQIAAPGVRELLSPMSREQYINAVADTVAAIDDGKLYQANITRKFCGRIANSVKGFDLFMRLVDASPAPYSAFMKMDDYCLLSSSPEQFLEMGPDGFIFSRPIKGTMPRFPDARRDEESRNNLAVSIKDRAENLMIVDLMRNDFARVCVPGSVEVEELFAVHSYSTVHHMVSTVAGRKKQSVPPLSVVRACFPPGSMTGAPKISAMKHCSAVEKLKRGPYGGAIGYFGGDGSFDLSVVIRTLVMRGDSFEFQVGGGIVHDSTPEGEWDETIAKARGIARALGLEESRLREI